MGKINKDDLSKACITNGISFPNRIKFYIHRNEGKQTIGFQKFKNTKIAIENIKLSSLQILFWEGTGAVLDVKDINSLDELSEILDKLNKDWCA